MRTSLLLFLVTTALASASRPAKVPAKLVSPLPNDIQQRQDFVPQESKTFDPYSRGAKVEQEGVVVQTGDWYKVGPAPSKESRGLFA